MSPRRVLIYPFRNEARLSGERATLEHAQELLAARGIELELAAQDHPVSFLPIAHFLRILRLRSVLRQTRAHSIIVKVPTIAQVPLVWLIALGCDKRIIVWIDGLSWKTPNAGTLARLLLGEPLLTLARAIFNNRCLARLVHPKFDFVVASQEQRAEVETLFGRGASIHVIPNGSSSKSASSTRMRQREQKLSLGYLGHTYLAKGVDDLLSALEILKRDGLAFRMRFALSELGSKRVRNRIRSEGYEILGAVEKADFFSSIDLLLAPYWVDWGTNVFPNVLLESLQFGVPTLTSDLPITREFFGSSENALFTEPANPRSIAEKLRAVIIGAEKLPSADRLVAHFQSKYSPEIIGKGWKDLLIG